jgi:hypothetical protein
VNPSSLASFAVSSFARHETFHPRYGWLQKGVSQAEEDPETFSRGDTTVRLGVGKNMVHAIRYWCLAFKVLEERRNDEHPRVPELVPSPFGVALLGHDGCDPFLEHVGSLWLLHWMLLRRPCLAPAWWVAFNGMASRQWHEDALTRQITDWADLAGWPSVVPASVKKDVDCLIRMYSSRQHGRQAIDDLLDCPFRELGLLVQVPSEARAWRFAAGEKPGLPDEIVGFACFDFALRSAPDARSISIARLASEPGGPGLAFRLSETDIHGALARLAAVHSGFRLAAPAGLRQILYTDDPEDIAADLLVCYYQDRSAPTQKITAAAFGYTDLRRALTELDQDLERESDVLRKLELHQRRMQLLTAGAGSGR